MHEKLPIIYIFYFDWENTSGNHAGMAYFFRFLQKRIDLPVRLLKTLRAYGTWRHCFRRLYRRFWVEYLAWTVKSGDIVYLTEYLGGRKSGDYVELASELRGRGVACRLFGLVHLPLNALRAIYDEGYIRRALAQLEQIVVFGSSLAGDLEALGFRGRVQKTFHFVDADFYQPAINRSANERLRVVAMGFLYRDRGLLEQIVNTSPNIDFELFIGSEEELHSRFSQYPNALLHRFLSEADLLARMQQADVSLSVFEDTVGSNVITTSLACGLPQVVSDVGSIRDYCSKQNTIFCRRPEDFTKALQHLDQHRDRLKLMGSSARQKAEQIALPHAIEWHRELFLKEACHRQPNDRWLFHA